MPELPEVETYNKYIQKTSLNQEITKAVVKNEKILENISKEKIEKNLKNASIIKTKRIGKYLFLILDKKNILVLHFGMTGNIKYYREKGEEPSHTRLLLTFSNNYYLAYDCQRLFGLVTLTKNITDYIQKKKLGIDALNINKKYFLDQIENRSTNIKSFIMNQKIFSGIGNIYADEILFQSRIHPEKKCNLLTQKQKEKVYENILYVLQTAVDHNAIIQQYPESFLLPHRRKDNLCPLNKNHEFNLIKIAGRTTYYCPKHQKK